MELSNVQNDICRSNDNLIITAGAGSGKTRVLVEKYLMIFKEAYESGDPLNIDQIVAITFTEKAAREMRERILSRIEEEINKGNTHPYLELKYEMPFARISTIHSFCARLIRESALYVDLDPDFKIVSGFTAAKRRSKIVESYMMEEIDKIRKFFEADSKTKFSDVRKWLDDAISYRWQENYLPEGIDEKIVELYRENAQKIVDIYRKTAIEESVLDFDDLLIFTEALLDKHEELRQRYADYFRYIFVDEFQDTNKLQSKIIELLRSTINKVWYIGDPKQSIYAFRGADVDVFLDMTDSAVEKRLSVKELSENHRSAPNLVEFYNRFFSSVFSDGRIKYSEQLKKQEEDMKPRVLLLENDGGDKAQDSRISEAQAIANVICKLNAEGTPFSDIAVLFRGLKEIWPVENALIDKNIPYHVIGGKEFFYKMEVLALKNLISIILDPYDNRAMTGFLLSKFCEIDLDELLILKRKNPKIYEAMKGDEKYSKIVNLVEKLMGLKNTVDLSKIMKIAISETNYLGKIANQKDGDKKIANVLKFIDLLDELDTPSWDIGAIWKLINEGSSEEESEEASALSENEDVVKMMTIHKSKGLEFPVVILSQIGKGIKESDKTQVELDEEKRILYVAMTRAKRLLVLSKQSLGENIWKELFSVNEFFADNGKWSIPQNMNGLIEIVNVPEYPPKNQEKRVFNYEKKYLEKVTVQSVKKLYNVTELSEKAGSQSLADPIYAIYGNVAHEILEKVGKEFTLKALLSDEFFTTYPQNIVHEVKRELLNLVEDPLVKEIEKAQEVKSELEIEIKIEKVGLQLMGKIDKILIDHERCKIIDFKYANYNPGKLKDYELQIRLYMIAYNKLTGRKVEGVIFFLKDGKKVNVNYLNEEALVNYLSVMNPEIKNSFD
jgi:ATP-dependent exoDNAse (exonuclease V) beta subunit